MFGFFIFEIVMKTNMNTKVWSHLELYLKGLKGIFNKELLILLYFSLLILGFTVRPIASFYDQFRIFEIVVLLFLGINALFYNKHYNTKAELVFLSVLVIGSYFWQQPLFVITELLLVYLLYKSFFILNYNRLITKIIVLLSFLLFLLFPLSLLSYINTGNYNIFWYPLPWNIRIYNSYFLITSIFAIWLYITETKYKNLYLIYIFLAFFAVLLDGGRSVTIAYTSFIIIITIFSKRARMPIAFTYSATWFAYLAITYSANSDANSLRIARESSSGRIDLWVNALQCWSQHPLVGCGFYQLDKYSHLSAHPHNLFIQVLTETGLIGFVFLALIIIKIAKNISWNIKQNYFVIAALLAVTIDMSLSGVHIYPITQMALLWLFVFLLKNPEFPHSQYFNTNLTINSRLHRMISLAVFAVITVSLGYLSLQAFTFSSDISLISPRFWEYGYQLL